MSATGNKLVSLIGILLSGCNPREKREVLAEYRLASYESKAFVDSSSFPAITTFSDNSFEVDKQAKQEYTGTLLIKGDNIEFRIHNGPIMHGRFLDTDKTTFALHQLTSINVEANEGVFKKFH